MYNQGEATHAHVLRAPLLPANDSERVTPLRDLIYNARFYPTLRSVFRPVRHPHLEFSPLFLDIPNFPIALLPTCISNHYI